MCAQESKFLRREVEILRQLLLKEEQLEQYELDLDYQCQLQERVSELESLSSHLQQELTTEKQLRTQQEEENQRVRNEYKDRYALLAHYAEPISLNYVLRTC